MIALVLAVSLAEPTAIDLARAAIAATNEMRLGDAERDARRAVAVAMTCGDVAGRAFAADALSVVYRMRGETEVAIGYSEEAVILADLLGDPHAMARAHTGRGRIYQDMLQRTDLARTEYEFVLALEPRLTDRTIVVRALINLGMLERPRVALERFNRAQRLAAKANDDYGRLASEHNIALIHLAQNDPTSALPHLSRALALGRSLKSGFVARTLLSISEAYGALGQWKEAADHLRRARASAVRGGDDLALATILLREADFQMERGDLTSAARALEESRAILVQHNDIASLPLADAYRAKLALARHDFRRAAELASAAARAARMLSQLDVVAQSEALAGTAFRNLRDLAKAKRALSAAIDAVEARRKLVAANIMSRSRFFEREVYAYEQMVAISAAEGHALAALRYSEMQKARALADLAGESSAFDHRDLERIEETLIEYAMAGDHVVAVVVEQAAVRMVTLPARRETIVALAVRFGSLIASRNEGFRRTARELHDLLWKPLGITAERVRIIPHETLWHVPFAALMNREGQFLVTTTTISYAVSIAVLRDSPRLGPQPRILAAANLPGEASEVDGLQKIYGTRATVLRGTGEATVKELAPSYPLLHFAAHGVYEQSDPLESYLRLESDASEDGRLTAREFLRLRLAARLVVISACHSAAGRIAPGEGLIGMTWALLAAGTPTVVAEQWEVESEVTTTVMQVFHENIVREVPAAEALRAAQRSRLRDVHARHPFYWAAFVVISAAR